MNRNERDVHVADVTRGESPPAKNPNFKKLKLVREIIRVSSGIRAGDDCPKTYGTRSV